jgi:protoporphyrinogen oxidase
MYHAFMQSEAASSCDVLILGGGPAGMAAAMELVRAGRHPLIVEKDAQVGGLAQTLRFEQPEGTYLTDIGPHRFFSKNKYLYDFIGDLLGEEWRKIPRHTRFFVDGKFYHYPVRLGQVLRNVGPLNAFHAMWDYLLARLFPREIRTFEDHSINTFGRWLAAFNMLNYTEKIWGIPCNQISVDWATQRIADLSIWSILKKALFRGQQGPKTLTDSFYYPSLGSGLIYRRIRERVEERGGEVRTSAQPVAIHWEGRRVTSVEVSSAGGTQAFSPQAVVHSVPLTQTVHLFHPSPPAEVMEAASALRFRSQVYLFLTVNRERIGPDNWVYFPDLEVPFGRMSEMKNFSERMCPTGRTSLFIEFFCFEGDDIWKASKEELFERSMPWLERLGFLRREEVTSMHHLRRANSYPLYDLSYHGHVQTVLRWLDGFENFYAVGRPGRFRYTNQDHSQEMGILAAQSILDGRRRDLDQVGAEDEYFERGFVPEQYKRVMVSAVEP